MYSTIDGLKFLYLQLKIYQYFVRNTNVDNDYIL